MPTSALGFHSIPPTRVPTIDIAPHWPVLEVAALIWGPVLGLAWCWGRQGQAWSLSWSRSTCQSRSPLLPREPGSAPLLPRFAVSPPVLISPVFSASGWCWGCSPGVLTAYSCSPRWWVLPFVTNVPEKPSRLVTSKLESHGENTFRSLSMVKKKAPTFSSRQFSFDVGFVS